MRARYPKDWPQRSRFIRKYRAQNRCEWCSAQNGEPHPETGSTVVLTVAHVYDHRPAAISIQLTDTELDDLDIIQASYQFNSRSQAAAAVIYDMAARATKSSDPTLNWLAAQQD